ncbi:DUF1759 domain-containing protein, partial [Lacticaseibacillus rhamnosus]|uniref:DUF1759 domain-containing protein n=1 Tax=Lacticaseibacillus rhamnosus TaxID=47715 RepID=UPI0013E9250F
MCMGLPKKELPRFNGDPTDYWRFYRAFTHGVARYTEDAANRLAYLITYCEGNARKAIEHCTILDPEEGYAEAWRILKRCYGEPHVIADKYLRSITDGPPIKADDETGLLMLAEAMNACELTLKQLDFASELNSRTTMSAILCRLPSTIQAKWYEVASAIMRTSRLPTFTELTRFIRERADAVATKLLYAPNLGATVTVRRSQPRDQASVPRLHTLATTSDVSTHGGSEPPRLRPICVRCGERHYLDQCLSFQSLTPDERRSYVQNAALCILCLKPKHHANQCKSRRFCGVNQCSQQHHPLLHQS